MKTPAPPQSLVGVKVWPTVTVAPAEATPQVINAPTADTDAMASAKRDRPARLIGATVSASAVESGLNGRPAEPEAEHSLARGSLHTLDVDVHSLSVGPG